MDQGIDLSAIATVFEDKGFLNSKYISDKKIDKLSNFEVSLFVRLY